MAVNIYLERNENENNLSVLRRFRTRLKHANIVKKVRGDRFYARPASTLQKKNSKLLRLARAEERARLVKLGKITDDADQTKTKPEK